jgi:nucleotide-binding universal stress UspA family protein
MAGVLVATDGSACADRAIDLAADLAKTTNRPLLIMTVGTSTGEDVRKLAQAEGGLAEALELISRQTLQSARERARTRGATAIEVRVAWGDPAQCIIEMAQHCGADIIVVGRRGRGRLSGLLLGSVSQKLVSLAPYPVIVVP